MNPIRKYTVASLLCALICVLYVAYFLRYLIDRIKNKKRVPPAEYTPEWYAERFPYPYV